MAGKPKKASLPATGDSSAAGKPARGASVVAQAGVLVAMTIAALGIGWVAGNYLRGMQPAAPATAEADASTTNVGHEASEAEAANKDLATEKSRMVIPLAPITTNIAAPNEVWVRLEASIALEGPPPDPGLADQIHQDLLAFVRTLKLLEIDGPSGFRHLRNDLDERAEIRSGGAVKQVLIRTLLFE